MIIEKTPVLVHMLPNEFKISVHDFTGKVPASLPGRVPSSQ
jgi:hypothetical protein